MTTNDSQVWFAMRVTYRREMKVRELLIRENIENYIPMRYSVRVVRGRKTKKLVPAVYGLVFVHTTQPEIQRIKSKVPYLQYIVNKRTGAKIIVPEAQMRLFIAVTGTNDEKLLWFKDNEINLTKGTRVRITAGEFEGYEGVFIKVKGARDRRVVVAIEGIVAVALATVSPDLIEPVV